MTELITAITEGELTRTKTIKGYKGETTYHEHYDAVVITTNQQVITIGIDNGQSCCESWGILLIQDDIQSFIGAELLGITTITRADLATAEKVPEDTDETNTLFINIQTSVGNLQVAVYNCHNGYYGHDVFVESTQLTLKDTL